jgi:hypothetical protein
MIDIVDVEGMAQAVADVRAAIVSARKIAGHATKRREPLLGEFIGVQARLIEHVVDVLEERARSGDESAVATMKEIDRRLAVDAGMVGGKGGGG